MGWRIAPQHRRCCTIQSQNFSIPTSPIHRRCIGDVVRSTDPIYSDPIWEASTRAHADVGLLVLVVVVGLLLALPRGCPPPRPSSSPRLPLPRPQSDGPRRTLRAASGRVSGGRKSINDMPPRGPPGPHRRVATPRRRDIDTLSPPRSRTCGRKTRGHVRRRAEGGGARGRAS